MTTSIPKITVKDKQLKFKPNVANYEAAYRDYNLNKLIKDNIVLFPENKINAAYNAVDRQILGPRKNKIALYLLDQELKETKLTFFELYQLSNRFGNLLKSLGVGRGDRVFFFLPRIPELFYGFLGTLKVGAVAGTMFSAFGVQALIDRLADSAAKVVVTNKELLPRIKDAKKNLPKLEKILVVEDFVPELSKFSDELHVARMDIDDPAFMLYTSGTTGKPKGVVHSHRAIIQEHLTSKWVLDLKEDDTYWCTADPGWVTGIAYEILGSLSNGAATVVYSGRFDPATWYKIIEKYRVSVWYTAPTAIRMLQAAGKEAIAKTDLSSLRHILSVGEPLNPEPLLWAKKTYGLAFHDTWWQTETGAIMIANFPCLPIKPGSMGHPVPGVTAAIVDDNGKPVKPMIEGNLAIKKGWPSMMKTIWRRPKKYESYFIGEWYISGDRGYMDYDSYFWFVGRADDVIKTAGERVGPFEVESALVAYPGVTEAGVIGKPDPIRGQIIKAFVTLNKDVKPSQALVVKLQEFVKKYLAGHAYPKEIEFVKSLPKTRSGKIMRRMLRAKELGLPIGDTSTLEEY
ncbi:acetate--CoA ligase [Candidatus Collierbacteria bacterium]|nr:acetate--CoA ligase [Candidatus Collierbacteria bacterium]